MPREDTSGHAPSAVDPVMTSPSSGISFGSVTGHRDRIEIIFVVRDVKFGLSPLAPSVVISPLMMNQMNVQSVTKTMLHQLMLT